MIADKNLVLFGDPGSNAVIARILEELPVKWTQNSIEVAGKKYNPAQHGLSLIYPNPLNPNRYVVINSGHSMHDAEFIGTNALLFPRLGDIAVQKFSAQTEGRFAETTEWSSLFNSKWKLDLPKSPVTSCGEK
ncbi:MAG: hypothetical protein NT013_20160 [Planctomycetia bacterium]|nr:hypothetical protein [Planctomycetia bacterium]